MLIDFAAEHQQYLKGRMEDGVWVFTRVNTLNPFSGIHLSTYQVFSSNGLGVALYVRNEVDDEGRAIKVHAGLKLLFSHKRQGRYLLAKDENRISLTLDIGASRYLYAWLTGAHPGFSYDLVRSGASPRQISGFETDREFPLLLRATEFSPTQGHRQIDVGLSDTDIFHIQMQCLALAKLLYPSISDTALVQHMQPRKSSRHAPAAPEAALPTQSVPDAPSISEPHSVHRSQKDGPDIDRTKKAVYAVGKNQWPAKDIQTIQYIQESSDIASMDRLIKAGNAGDFTEWDKIHTLIRSGRA